MSERDEPEAKTQKRKKGRRRSLRVPVDEVPRPTQSADAVSVDGGATVEIPAFDEDRVTLDEVNDPSQESALESVEAPLEELDEELLGAPRDGEESAAPLEAEATVAQEPPSEAAEPVAVGGAAAALAVDAPSLEVELDDALEDSDANAESDAEKESVPDEPVVELRSPKVPAPEPSTSEAPAAVEAPRPPVVGVIVQRVVSVISAPRRPEDEAAAHTQPGTEPAVDDEEPELRVGEAEARDLEELEVDLDDGAPADEARSEPPELQRDSAPELALDDALEDDALEEEADALLEDEVAAAAAKRTSVRPPPPPSNKAKDATPEAPPAPPASPVAAPPPEPAVASAAPAAALKKKKPRRHWWEDLFNDDYLRTVPIPHPRVIERQCDFIEARFGLPQGATLLDVGCGLGLHAVELTRRGYLVVGLDLSLPMLARAADEAQDQGFKINFLHADMREMSFEGAFDAVLCYGTTFGYFDDETNKLVVERLYRALKPRGLLLLDVVNRDFVIRNQPNLVWFEGDGCVVMEESQMNYITSRLEVKRNVILDNGRQRDNVYSLRSYSLHELGQILHQQGFRVVEVTGWEAHPGVFFGGDSPKLIILAQRRPQGPPTPPGRNPSGEMSAVGSEPAPAPQDTPSGETFEPAEASEGAPERAAEPSEPSTAVSEALAEALEQSGELEISARQGSPDEDELDPEELADDDLQDPEG